MPFRRLPLEAFVMASLTASAVVFFFASMVRSIKLTLAVGTRIEVPSSLHLSSGSTSQVARAAPVEVGIIDSDAARARPGPWGGVPKNGEASGRERGWRAE